jgi:hypothetical protein
MSEEEPVKDSDGAALGQGCRWEGEDRDELHSVVEAAFDYRGDVTLLLRDGGETSGYLANRDVEVDEPFLDFFPSSGGRERILYRDLRGLEFSGKDTASGKSWETWIRKWNEKKEAESRGEKVEGIDLFPDAID